MTGSNPPPTGQNAAGWPDGESAAMAPTGRYVVVLSDEVFGRESAEADALRSVTGAASVASTSDFGAAALDVDQAAAADATMFADLGIGVVTADQRRAALIIAAGADDSRIVAVEPEQIMHALSGPDVLSADYLHGYRDATEHLYEHASHSTVTSSTLEPTERFVDTPGFTWGLHATGVTGSPSAGEGIGVAVLDTGLDLDHPDFAHRAVFARSFVSAESAFDGNGHGTHCVGTACGPENPPQPPGSRRYGVAGESEVLVGKVLGNGGSGTDTGILAAINWAVANGCPVISMSLGADIRSVSYRYETVGRRALGRGSLIVAAAGNNAGRTMGNPGFVGLPANSPSIMAVAALDATLRIADFSARSNPVEGGQIDIAAPGVDVYSAWPMPSRYHSISGTSMATPHVAGIAALWAQHGGARGEALWASLVRNARRCASPALDVGSGLARAPL